MIVYVTEMLRWGDTETHHYVQGVYSNSEQAKLAGEVEKSWRGGKYEYQISEFKIDAEINPAELKNHFSCAALN